MPKNRNIRRDVAPPALAAVSSFSAKRLTASFAAIRGGAKWVATKASAFVTMETVDPALNAASDNYEALLHDVDEALDARTFSVKFSKMIEEKFEAETKKSRADLFIRLAVVGVSMYNAFLLLDIVLIPDVIREVTFLQLGIATPITLVSILCMLRFDFDANVAAFFSVISMIVCTALALTMTRSPDSGLYACLFCLFVMSVNVCQAWPFRWALFSTLITNIIAIIAVSAHPTMADSARVTSILILGAASYYSLIGNYRIDTGVRRGYLFALRENLRARLLEITNQKLRSTSMIDGLTGVGNRRFFEECLRSLWDEPDNEENVSLLMLDIDHFKKINDNFGHQTGDACLIAVAQALSACASPFGHILARYGGEEFAVIMRNADADEAYTFAEALRGAIERLEVRTLEDTGRIRPTVSVGYATAPAFSRIPAADVLAAADSALYLAKRKGRNRTESADLVFRNGESRSGFDRRARV